MDGGMGAWDRIGHLQETARDWRECSVLSTIPRIHGQARAPSGQQTTELDAQTKCGRRSSISKQERGSFENDRLSLDRQPVEAGVVVHREGKARVGIRAHKGEHLSRDADQH